MWFRSIVGAMLLAGAFSSTPGAAPLENYQVGNWNVGAYSNDQTGEFSHCAMLVPYQSGIIMLFAVNRSFQWSVGFANPQWTLTPGSFYDLTFWIDGRAPEAARATTLTPTLVQIPLEPNRALFERFRRGYKLTVAAAGQMFYFNLDGTARGLSAVLDCTQRHVMQAARGQYNNPFVPPPGTPQAGPTAATKAEATALVANVLSLSGITGFYILQPNQVPKELAAFDVVWMAPDVIGTLLVVPPDRVPNPNNISVSLISADAASCKGKFVSGTVPSDTTTGDRGIHVFTACEVSGNFLSVFYNAVPRSAGGYYLFAVTEVAKNGEQAKAADANIRQAVLKAIRN